MVEQIVVHPHRPLLNIKARELPIHTITWMNPQRTMQSEKKPVPKGCILYDSIYITFFK